MSINPNIMYNIYNNVFNWINTIGYDHTNDEKKLTENDIKKKFSFYP